MVNYVPTSETENLTAKNIVRYVDECNRDSSYFKTISKSILNIIKAGTNIKIEIVKIKTDI